MTEQTDRVIHIGPYYSSAEETRPWHLWSKEFSANYQPFHNIKNNGASGLVKAQIPVNQFT